MQDQSLQVIHIPNEAVDPLLSFASEWEPSTRPTRSADVVVATLRQTASKAVRVPEQSKRQAVSSTGRPAMLKCVSLFVSGAAAGAAIAVLLSGDSSVNTGVHEAHRAATAVSVSVPPPQPAPSPVIDAVSVGTTGTPEATAVDSGVYRGMLRVTSQPANASVFINGSFAGRTPLVIRTMPVGSRAVRVTLDGYTSWSGGVRIVANESTTVAAELHPAKTAHD